MDEVLEKYEKWLEQKEALKSKAKKVLVRMMLCLIYYSLYEKYLTVKHVF